MNRKIAVLWFTQIVVFALVASIVTGCGSSTKTSTSTTANTTPAPTVTAFTASANSVSPGDGVTLTWTQTNATTVKIDNGVGTVTGNSTTIHPTATTTYTITVSNTTGTATKTVTVTVVPVPVIASFTAADLVLTPATTGAAGTTLSWEVTGAGSLSIDNKIGTVTGTSAAVSPSATTTYTLSAANSLGNANGTVTATVTVKVRNNLAALNGTPFAGTDRSNYFSSWNQCASPYYLAADADGNIYSTDWESESVCKITPAGNVTVLATNAGAGYNNYSVVSNGPFKSSLASARFRPGRDAAGRPTLGSAARSARAMATGGSSNLSIRPEGIAVSSDGKAVYFTDEWNYYIRKISIGSDGTPTTSILAGHGYGFADGPGATAEFYSPGALALDGAGNLYVADRENYAVRKIATDGTVSTLAGHNGSGHINTVNGPPEFGWIEGLAVSNDGSTVYVAEENDGFYGIRKIVIDADKKVTVSDLAGGSYGYADGPGYDKDGAGNVAQFRYPGQLSLSADGTTLYMADGSNEVIRQIVLATDGPATVSTIAGFHPSESPYGWYGLADGKPACFDYPFGLTADAKGNVYIASDNEVDMTLRKLVLSTGEVSSVVMNIYGNTGGSADDTGNKAAFSFMLGSSLVTDNKGTIYVSDTGNNTIRMINTDSDGNSVVSTLAGVAGKYGHDDGTGSNALFAAPQGMALTADGTTLYVADTRNGTIRSIDVATGVVKTPAGDAMSKNYSIWPFDEPRALAIGPDGLLYIAGWFYDNEEGNQNTIGTLNLDTGGVKTLAVTDSTDGLYSNRNITGFGFYTNSDKSKIYLYASSNCAVFKIDLSPAPPTEPAPAVAGTPAGPTVTTLAGSSICGYQDGPATAALFSPTQGLAVDSLGNVYVGDVANSVVRRISTDGNVTTVVGSYPSTVMTMGPLPSSIYGPANIAIDSTDNLLVVVPNAVLTLVP